MTHNPNTLQHISEIVEQLMGQLETLSELVEHTEPIPEFDLLDGDDNKCFFI